ncbi:hypothetical protein [Halovenus marina]|uniref:hypothetical protein n=1 Tax=Halovenus marina TaxID=3396621 RepID=UPI003F577F9E
MNPFVRFWLLSLSLITGVAALGYLFLSFLFPGSGIVADNPNVRLAVTMIGVTALGVFVWSFTFAETAESARPIRRN